MTKDFEYFKDFLANPSDYSNRVFQEYLEEWLDYVQAHADEFDYLKDDEWKEIRERIIAEIELREEIREEFNEISDLYDIQDQLPDRENLKLLRRMLEYVTKYEKYYELDPAYFREFEEQIKTYEQATVRAEISQMNLRLADYEVDQSLAALDEILSKVQQTTGKTPILTTLSHKKKPKGN